MAERQTAPTLAGIRQDHVGRYRHAAGVCRGEVLDAACGVGYGSQLLATVGCRVRGVDRDAAAIQQAQRDYAHERVTYTQADVLHVSGWYDWAVCFETLEHVPEDGALLRQLRRVAPRLLLSVPNQAVLPFTPARFPFHVRHYTPAELDCLLRGAGWEATHWYSQPDAYAPDIVEGTAGRTLVVTCIRSGR